MIKKYYYEEDNFKLIQGDSLKVLRNIEPNSIDMVFADPPYFLSNNGISCSAGKMVSVNKGPWDKAISIKEKHEFNKKWIRLCKKILKEGYSSEGTNVRTRWEDGSEANYISVVGVSNVYDVGKEFPMITLRNNSKTVLRAIDEILWIWQKKSNNIKDLNSHIWDSWADKDGSIGKAYGYQLGKLYPYKDVTLDGLKKAFPDGEYMKDEFAGTDMFVAKNGDDVIRWYAMKITGMWNMDQVNKAIYDLKNTPFSLRIITSIYNFEDLTEMALYPCAYSMTFNVTQDKDSDKLVLNAILNQRSNDILAAGNWNVCQYALLLMMMAQVCDMEAGELLHVVADCHIYDRHIPLIKELIQRKPYPAPVVKLNPEVKDFYQFTTDDLIVENYETWSQIKNIPIAV